MIIVVKKNHEESQMNNLINWIKSLGMEAHLSVGDNSTIIGLIGDTTKIDIGLLSSMDIVETVKRIQEPYKNVNRKFHPEDSVVNVGGQLFGGNNFSMIAGPCSVESEEQIVSIARSVKEAGAGLLRGGAFKPRSSPYAFQGLKAQGIEMLLVAKKETGMPIVTEIMDVRHLDLFSDVDMIQVGARNMQNFELLRELGHSRKPILLKRGLANTIEEWLMSAEYIMAGGNNQVVLCERGIRTFEPYTRNTLDLSAIPVVKERSHLPIIVDPSHATGVAKLVEPMSLASVGAGADGLIIEVHNNPACALCDGAQSLKPDAFTAVVRKVDAMLAVVGKVRQ